MLYRSDMTVGEFPRGRGALVLASLAVGLGLVLTGCSAQAEPSPPATPVSASASSDAETCAAFGDVMTMTANADVGLRDGRMAQQEQQGWYRLAARVLDRVPTSGDGAVSDAVDALKDIVPAPAPGAMGTSAFGSDEWNSAQHVLATACTAAGSELTISMFTGG